jgi:hypothetical protein
VQVHFKDARNKRLDIVHELKLDWTLTGLETFGGETCSLVDLVINKNDYVDETKTSKALNDVAKKPNEQLSYDLKTASNEEQMSDTNDTHSTNNSNSNSGFDFIETLVEPKISNSTGTNTSASSTPSTKANIDDLLNLRFNKLSSNTIASVVSPIKKSSSPLSITPSTKIELKIEAPTSPALSLVKQQQPPPKQVTKPLLPSSSNIKAQPRITQIASKPPPTLINPAINPNKKCVIYKVESADLKQQASNSSRTNLKSLQHKPTTQTLTTISAVHRPQPVNILNSAKKQSKIGGCQHLNDHNTFQTKSVVKQEEKNKKTDQPPIKPAVAAPTSPLTHAQTMPTQTVPAPSSSKVYKMNETLVLNSIYKQFNSFDDFIKFTVNNVPLFSTTSTSKANSILPFCANSANEYFKWPLPKRKAAEWMRATYIKEKVGELICKHVS